MLSPIGHRFHVVGNTGSGKSTLASRLAIALGVPFVELDALNWLPGWVSLADTDPAELTRRIEDATSGDGWAMAGSYSRFSEPRWARVETVIWLDLPLPLILWRVLSRSWRRSRAKELLWGTNYERFWPQLAVWRREESLVWWAVTNHRRKRRRMLAHMTDPRWAHVRFIRLTSPGEVEAFTRTVEGACRAGTGDTEGAPSPD